MDNDEQIRFNCLDLVVRNMEFAAAVDVVDAADQFFQFVKSGKLSASAHNPDDDDDEIPF